MSGSGRDTAVEVRARLAGAPRVAQLTGRQTISSAAAMVDCTFLALVMCASLAFYVGTLGFYYDDYKILQLMSASDDHSLLGLYDSVRPRTGPRQVQALVFAGLYRMFGVDPLGYHITNACVVVIVTGLLYLVLRELRLPRLVCVAVPLVYSTLPHFSTDRFWLAAFQANVSTALYLLSLYAGLRAVRASLPALTVWLLVALLGVAGTLFAYEVLFPLSALSVGLIWWSSRRLGETEVRRGAVAITTGALVAAMIAVALVKASAVAEESQNGYEIGFQNGFLHHIVYLVSGSIKLNLGTYFLAFPYVLWWIFRNHFSAENAAVAGVCGVIAFLYLRHIGRRGHAFLENDGLWRALIGVGLATVVLGYSIFLTTESVLFRSAGIDNRVNVAAGLGVVGLFIGLIGWLAGRLQPRWSLVAFSATVACAVASGVFVINTLASFWESADHRQQEIVSALRRETGTLPASATVILDGSCPEIGPAVVFADDGDLTGALRLAFHDPSLQADVSSETLRADVRGLILETTLLGNVFTRSYEYTPHLLIYDATSGRLYHLLDKHDAARYLADSRPSFRCAPQRSFAWGFDPARRWSLL
jgi:hypothetical protein